MHTYNTITTGDAPQYVVVYDTGGGGANEVTIATFADEIQAVMLVCCLNGGGPVSIQTNDAVADILKRRLP